MKKRLFTILLTLCMMVLLLPVASADVIFEPEDAFYESHREDCDYVSRSFTANGPDGRVIVYHSPENAARVTTMENGEVCWISFVYTAPDGLRWGYLEEPSGWIPMDYLVVVYDYISFAEEFGDRIVSGQGNLHDYTGCEVFFWSYPGSESCTAVEIDGDYAPEYGPIFVDDGGRTWGCCGYYFGHRNFWICLDDPTADYDTLYAELPPQQVTHPNVTAPAGDITPNGGSGILFATIAVIAVVAATALILRSMKKKQ